MVICELYRCYYTIFEYCYFHFIDTNYDKFQQKTCFSNTWKIRLFNVFKRNRNVVFIACWEFLPLNGNSM